MAKIVIGSDEDPLLQIYKQKEAQRELDQKQRLKDQEELLKKQKKLSETWIKGLSWNRSE